MNCIKNGISNAEENNDHKLKFSEQRIQDVKNALRKKLHEIVGGDAERTVLSLTEDELDDLGIEMLYEFQRQMSSIIIRKEERNFPIDLDDLGI